MSEAVHTLVDAMRSPLEVAQCLLGVQKQFLTQNRQYDALTNQGGDGGAGNH